MKKLILFAVIAIAIVSCGPKKVEPAATNQDSIATVDTLQNDSVATDSAAVKADSTATK